MFRIEFGDLNSGFDYVKWATNQGYVDGVQLFVNLKKLFPKKQTWKVDLADSRQIGECQKCKTPIHSHCFIKDCSCVSQKVEYCCLCAGTDGWSEANGKVR